MSTLFNSGLRTTATTRTAASKVKFQTWRPPRWTSIKTLYHPPATKFSKLKPLFLNYQCCRRLTLNWRDRGWRISSNTLETRTSANWWRKSNSMQFRGKKQKRKSFSNSINSTPRSCRPKCSLQRGCKQHRITVPYQSTLLSSCRLTVTLQ